MSSTPENAADAPNEDTLPAASDAPPEIVRRVLRALAGLDYGSVEIVVHERKVVQIDRRQKSRFSRPLDIPAA